MNPDFAALLSALCAAEARFLVVGAYALAWYGFPRSTRDLDLWVEPTPDNAMRVMDALRAFGAPLEGLTHAALAQPGIVLQIGVAPVRVDILTVLDGLSFCQAWEHRIAGTLDGQHLPFLCRADFIRNKRAVGRPQDLADVARLGEL